MELRIEESPFYGFQGQSVLDVNIRGDEEIVIVVDEVVDSPASKGNQPNGSQQGRHSGTNDFVAASI